MFFVQKNQITNSLTHTVSVSADESMVYLKVDLTAKDKKGPFSTEKSFRNNIFGLEEIDITIKSLDNELKVRRYFGIGEDKNE